MYFGISIKEQIKIFENFTFQKILREVCENYCEKLAEVSQQHWVNSPKPLEKLQNV